MGQPNLTDKCIACTHEFAEHAVSYSGSEHGCLVIRSASGSDPRETVTPATRCRCEGFTYRYTGHQIPPKYPIHRGDSLHYRA